MKILVTGGLGYIGNVLIKKLLNESQYLITCLDNCMFDQSISDDLKKNNKFEFVNGDVCDHNLVKKIVSDKDIIIPLAALVGAPLCKKYPEKTSAVNLEAIKFLKSVVSKDQKIILPVTNSGYGIGKKDEFCDEKSPLNPISLYGRTKVEAEKEVMDRENSISFRLATVFGPSPRMRIDLLVNNFTYLAFKEKYIKLFEPHFRRNYIHVEDVASGFVFAIKNFQKLKGEIFNLGLSEANLTKEELCKEIKKIITDFNYDISLDGEDPDKRDYFVSNKKIENLGFKAKISVNHGIQQLVEMYSNKNFNFSNNY